MFDYDYVYNSIRSIPDFPKAGIIFKDITTLLNNKDAFKMLIQHLTARYADQNIDFIAGIESRGFIFGSALAYALGVGFVPIRKKGKLPCAVFNESYELEYGSDTLEIHQDAFENSERKNVLLIDDLIATGGTAKASLNLIQKAGGNCLEACFILEIEALNASKNFPVDLYSVIKV